MSWFQVKKVFQLFLNWKEEGRTRFSKSWQGCSEGFPEGKARGKSWGASLPAWGKPCSPWLFLSDLHFISNTVFQITEISRPVRFCWMLFQLTSDDKLHILTQLSFHKFVVQNTYVINYFVVGLLWKVEKSSKRLWQDWEQVISWIPYFFSMF